jgi:hypothetical protein
MVFSHLIFLTNVILHTFTIISLCGLHCTTTCCLFDISKVAMSWSLFKTSRDPINSMLLDNCYVLMPCISPTFGIELLAPCPPCYSDCPAKSRKLPCYAICPTPKDVKVCKACKAYICCNGFHCPMFTLDNPPNPPCIPK